MQFVSPNSNLAHTNTDSWQSSRPQFWAAIERTDKLTARGKFMVKNGIKYLASSRANPVKARLGNLHSSSVICSESNALSWSRKKNFKNCTGNVRHVNNLCIVVTSCQKRVTVV